MSHNEDKLYPWVDINPITSYHSQGHSFLDRSTKIMVSDQAQEPQMSIIDVPKVGAQSRVTCKVKYTCSSAPPALSLNGIPGTDRTIDSLLSDGIWERTIERTWNVEEDHKKVECTVRYPGGQSAKSELLLHVESFRVLAADVPRRFNALTRSCVVIPCSFQDDEDQPLTRGIWYKKTGGLVYHNARSDVLDQFKDRTKILGNLDEGDCSLEIDDIKPFDNGPFCFYGEKGTNKYRFNNSCVFIVMKASPEKPVMSLVPAQVNAGSTVNVSCSVSHSCSSHPPKFSWSVPYVNNEVSDTEMSRGVWKTTSTITFVVAGGDGQRNLNCTAIFWRGKNETRTFKLIVEGTTAYQMQKAIPVVIPVVILVLILFAVLLGIFFYRKRDVNIPHTPKISLG
ncbi:sialic acid-binding Ig-like lectin 12 [Poeciliopsis prolifica]|uniref:sialic acid-binding Ig-like lectin 12 n=1 Tax=Poeciliopsis prolifica TaxID=188132 RepID=UPI0024144920|nr:sialic acid-binding Ig-like lectin 12 [Poeciliopsis prolifica]